MTASVSTPALIALDWGTTSLRAYLLGADGLALDTRASSAGIMNLPAGGFDQAFEETCGAWLDAHAHLPVIAAGMVGSAQGWVEAPYVETPANADALVAGIVDVKTARGVVLHVVPGVLERGVLPNVMRGEETQIFGALASEPALGNAGGALIGLPGTHAKWAFVADERIERFYTFMTGETFSALRDHTILGRTMHPTATHDEQAFLRGVDTARDAGHPGMLATIFSTRTLGLTGQLSAEQQSDYLSGLLIGHELRGLNEVLTREQSALAGKPLRLIGNDALCNRYRAALARFGCHGAATVAHATEHGLYGIAALAGLVAARRAA
ncbi:2-dehydro-3-deoxygalactonokinase [Caballeronia zhejiangensis]|uniref:2-dehydro-3-deoxygalactonokinase n=1 Tax=Caballeronia zhejiangensis TaxID=871203 RepID=A0A656QLA3_9BURK|nr:2-dehydro-3-deoxygalactonokinase [Caballeronia zhejiangensis]EKS73427.1 2-keto-3-deoxygalactonate kinase [Burkholderia sp. SJ98]KDR31279.1 2-dehydro-3-deoxygalactonokinase [Caballeronia zhejiangensis]